MSTLPPLEGIDTHAHVFSSTAPPVGGARYRPAYAARLPTWQALWPLAGITRGVLVQPSFFGTNNAEMLAAIAQDPLRLRGVAVVERTAGDEQLARLEDGGVRAVRLNLKGAEEHSAFMAADWKAFFARIHARGWHVEIYVDHGRLPEVAVKFNASEVAVVLDHFGNPGIDKRAIEATFDAAEKLAMSRAVWCKLSGPYRLGGTDRLSLGSRWLEVLGPARLVWGSDWPYTSHESAGDYRRLHEDLAASVGKELRGAVLWDNAARLYRFD